VSSSFRRSIGRDARSVCPFKRNPPRLSTDTVSGCLVAGGEGAHSCESSWRACCHRSGGCSSKARNRTKRKTAFPTVSVQKTRCIKVVCTASIKPRLRPRREISQLVSTVEQAAMYEIAHKPSLGLHTNYSAEPTGAIDALPASLTSGQAADPIRSCA
jgi:hypothetical protein